MFDNFLKFSTLIHILGRRKWCVYYLQHLKGIHGIWYIIFLYEETKVLFKVHGWIQLPDHLEVFWTIFYSFPFDSFMQLIHQAVTSRSIVARQAFCRVEERMSERSLYYLSKVLDNTVSSSTHLLPSLFSHAIFASSFNTDRRPEIVFLINDGSSSVESMNNNQPIIRPFKNASDFFTWPFSLSHINII